MAILSPRFSFRPFSFRPGGSISASTHALDASTDKVGWVFQMDESATLVSVGINGTLTNTSPTYKISLQGVDGSGNPDGTVLGGGSPASVSQTLVDGWQYCTLDNSYAVTQGDYIAVVVEYASGTIDGSNNFSVEYALNNFFNTGVPYALTNTGSWTKQGGRAPVPVVKSSTRAYGAPVDSTSSSLTSTTGNRVAMKFNLDAGWGDTYQVVGISLNSRVAVGNSFLLGLWNAAGTAQQTSLSIDKDFSTSSGAWLTRELFFADTTLADLSFGTTYYVGVESESSQQCGFDTIVVDSNSDLSAYPGGISTHLATWNGSAWSDVDTEIVLMDLIIADITEPSGGGGGLLTHPGMQGGMRG